MKCNAGKTDPTLKAIAGVVVIVTGVYFHSWWEAIGIVPLFTASLGWCLAYLLLAKHRNKIRKQ